MIRAGVIRVASFPFIIVKGRAIMSSNPLFYKRLLVVLAMVYLLVILWCDHDSKSKRRFSDLS